MTNKRCLSGLCARYWAHKAEERHIAAELVRLRGRIDAELGEESSCRVNHTLIVRVDPAFIFDSQRFRTMEPTMYEAYCTAIRKGGLRITIAE